MKGVSTRRNGHIRQRAGWTVMLMSVLLFLPLPATAQSPGQLTGGKMSEHPDWFKESFLDIAEDVDEAAAEGRHVMLFLHLSLIHI